MRERRIFRSKRSHVIQDFGLVLFGRICPSSAMYIESVPNRNSPPAILLRESYREGGKVRKRTLCNLSDWPTATRRDRRLAVPLEHHVEPLQQQRALGPPREEGEVAEL